MILNITCQKSMLNFEIDYLKTGKYWYRSGNISKLSSSRSIKRNIYILIIEQ